MSEGFAVAFFQNKNDNQPQQVKMTWVQVVNMLTTHERRDNKDDSCWVPAEFKGKRAKANVTHVSLAVFDLDSENPEAKKEDQRPIERETFSRVLGEIDKSGWACVVHTSHSATAEHPKSRLVFRPSRSILPGEWPIVRQAVIDKFSIPADRAAKDCSRLFYTPAAPEGAWVFASEVEGESFDVDSILKGQRTQALTERAAVIADEKLEEAKAAALKAQSEPVDMDALRKVLKTSKAANAELIKSALKGEQVAFSGSRDDTINLLASAIAFSVPSSTPLEAIYFLVSDSLDKIPREVDEKTGQLEDWHATFKEKLNRAWERRIGADAARQADFETIFGRLRAEASRAAAPPLKRPSTVVASDAPGSSDVAEVELIKDAGMYTDEEMATWAMEQGCADLLDFTRRWIITRGNSFYLFAEGRYLAPIPRENLEHSVTRDFSRAPVAIWITDKQGNRRMRDLKSILHDHSTVARAVEASLSLQKSYYEPGSQTFYEAVTPIRRLAPTEHPEIQKWIDLLDPTGRLTDWIATASRLDRQSCAIYLDGPPGCGKSLLATGLARLWTTGGPSELARVLDGFNESLVSCPLVFADESLPQRKGITAELRRFIGSTKRTLNRKFLPAAPLEGAVRVIIAGNNDRLLDTGEELSSNDLQAVAGRIYYIKADQKPADYLVALGGPPHIQKWVDNDWLAEHALWLKETRRVNENARFLVEGNASEFHRHLATGTGMAGLVCEWLARYLTDAAAPITPLIQVGEGELWVNTEALAKATQWERYVPSMHVPSAGKIGRALRGLAHAQAQLTVGGKTYTYHRIESQLVLTWVDRLQIGDVGATKTRLEGANELIRSAL